MRGRPDRLGVGARLRALARGSEAGLVGLACATGAVAGLVVVALSGLTQALREFLFRLPPGTRLSAASAPAGLTLLLGPMLGGLALGVLLHVLARRQGRQPGGQPGGRRAAVDPIEANALHGGRMSLRDSAALVAQNVVSNGSGASVGLEAAYTQAGSSLASRLGAAFGLRRADLRTLVGCGSAAGIAAAFGAPLTGAFYAFELVMGTYTIATLAPVTVAAVCGSLVAGALTGQAALAAPAPPQMDALDTLPCLALGLICAGLAVAVMRGVTLVEGLFQAAALPAPLRPALGGLCVGVLGLAVSPQVLSGGHGALHLHLAPAAMELGAGGLAALLAAKAAASAVSIGSGFRGGLFFASLFLGALTGKLFHALAQGLETFGLETFGLGAFHLGADACAVVGMAAFAAAVVGGPLTMTFLALETTGSVPLTGLVLAAVIAASLTVRRIFGYSFATWRFHLRGESIRSAHDVGWIRSLTVGRLMRPVRTVRDTPLAAFLAAHPLGSATQVVVADADGRYAGLLPVAEAHAFAAEHGADGRLDPLLRQAGATLSPGMNAREAMAAFAAHECEALAVTDAGGRVVGLLTESHTLRRYSEELDRQRRDALGETA